MRHHWIMPDHPLRSQVEAFICERYWLNFKACLRQLPSHLLAVFDEQTDNLDGELVAACGIQFADQQVLFSQAYLDRSPQHYCIDGRPLPGYGQLAEVGSMAAVAVDYLPSLFGAVIEELQPLGRTAVIFTATRALQKYFARQGIVLTQLAEARPTALPESVRDLWGNYYQHQPLVLAGWLKQGGVFTAHKCPMTNVVEQGRAVCQ